MTAPAEQSMGPADANRNPYACAERETLAAAKCRVAVHDYVIASVLAAFAGILGLFLGPALAVGLLTGGILADWLTPDERIHVWLVACSLLFGPLLAALAFRGHLQAVRASRHN